MNLSPSQLIRIVLALGVVLLTLLLLWALLLLTATGFDVLRHLSRAPAWFYMAYGLVFLGVAGTGGYFIWRALRTPRPQARDVDRPAEDAEPPSHDELVQRIDEASEAGVDTDDIRRELALLEARKEAGELQVAFFGEISAGKSSLIKALVPSARPGISVRGGTTREVGEYRWQSPGGDSLVLVDMPGTNEVGRGLDELAQAEALRSHVVVYVCEGDLTRSQFDDLNVLLELDKPTILALNKIDRYRPEEREAILARLKERAGDHQRLEIVAVQAGGKRELIRVLPDGQEERVVREMPPRVDELRDAIQTLIDTDADVLETLRDTSVFVLVAQRLDAAELEHTTRRADELTKGYSKKAMIGAMAAVAPGSDLVIQGYLAVSLIMELAKLYGVPVKRIDTDLLVSLIQKRVARSTTIMLAIAGNALKAFPGAGTLVGGLVHAAAYGMIFEALGKAVAASLASRGALRPEQAAKAFEENLSGDLETRAKRFAALALEIRREARAERRGEQ